jgi:hypothetical protein
MRLNEETDPIRKLALDSGIRFTAVPARTPREASSAFSKAWPKSAESAESGFRSWLGTGGANVNANARDIAARFPVIREGQGHFWCDSCGQNFVSIGAAEMHAATHLDTPGTAQLRTGSSGVWEEPRAKGFDLTSSPLPGSQIDAGGTKVEWKPREKSVSSDDLRKMDGATAGYRRLGFEPVVNWLIEKNFSNLSARKTALLKKFAIEEIFDNKNWTGDVVEGMKRFAKGL